MRKTKVPNRFPPPPTNPTLASHMQFKPLLSFFALQVDHETDSDISFSIPTTETECKGKYKRESFYVPDEASQESEVSLTDVQDEFRELLNRLLQARDISPVRHVLSVP